MTYLSTLDDTQSELIGGGYRMPSSFDFTTIIGISLNTVNQTATVTNTVISTPPTSWRAGGNLNAASIWTDVAQLSSIG
jgi:hypothetical protein